MHLFEEQIDLQKNIYEILTKLKVDRHYSIFPFLKKNGDKSAADRQGRLLSKFSTLKGVDNTEFRQYVGFKIVDYFGLLHELVGRSR